MYKDLNYQLGVSAAEYFIVTALPTLSTDMLQSNNVIKVSEELTKEWREKQEKYRYGDDSIFFSNLEWYKENIEKVYLEKEILIRVPKVIPTDVKLFGKGFETALWNCDKSHYKYGELLPNSEYAWCSEIKLIREDV